MRHIFCLLMMIVLSVCSYAQQTTPQIELKESLLEKSKKQKKAGFIMLIGGAALIGTAILLPRGEYEGWELDPITGISESYSNDGIKGVFGLTGVLSMLGSIPVFMASSRNNKKAMSLSLKTETAPQLQNSNWVSVPVPSLTVRLSL